MKKKFYIHISRAICLLLLLCVAFCAVSCSRKKAEPENPVDLSLYTVDAEGSSAAAAAELSAAIPGDFTGSVMRVAICGANSVSPKQTDSLYDESLIRNIRVSSKYGINVRPVYLSEETATKQISDANLSGEPIAEAALLPSSMTGALVASGSALRLDSLPYLGETASSIFASSLSESLGYAISGGFSFAPDSVYCVYVNTLTAGIGADVLNSLVSRGEWTWSRFFELCSACARDIDCYAVFSGEAENEDVLAGIVTASRGFSFTAPVGGSQRVSFIGTEAADELLKCIRSCMTFSRTDISEILYVEDPLKTGKAAFRFDTLEYLSNADGVKTLVLPLPKADAKSDYHSYVSRNALSFTALGGTGRENIIGAYAHALVLSSGDYLCDSYISKSVSDDTSRQIAKLIWKNASFDFSRIYASGCEYLAAATYGLISYTVKSGTELADYDGVTDKANSEIENFG